MTETCKHPGCDRPKGKAFGWCNAHYQRNAKGADMDTPIRDVHATDEERFWSKVRKTSSCWIWIAANVNKYGVFRINGANQIAHRVSYQWANGEISDDVQLDHMCHNRSCVNPDHLRFADYVLNGQNRSAANKNSKSGIRGVYWIEERQCWIGAIQVNRKTIRTDGYVNIEDAEKAVIDLRRKHMPYSLLDQRKDEAA